MFFRLFFRNDGIVGGGAFLGSLMNSSLTDGVALVAIGMGSGDRIMAECYWVSLRG